MPLLLLGVYFDVLVVTMSSKQYKLRAHTHTAQHSATYQMTQIFSDNAVRMPNPAVTVLPADTGTEVSSYIYLVSLLCFLNLCALFFVHYSLCIILCALFFVHYSLCIMTPHSSVIRNCTRPSEYCGHSAMGYNVCSESVTAVSYRNNGATSECYCNFMATAWMGGLLTACSMRGMDDGGAAMLCV